MTSTNRSYVPKSEKNSDIKAELTVSDCKIYFILFFIFSSKKVFLILTPNERERATIILNITTWIIGNTPKKRETIKMIKRGIKVSSINIESKNHVRLFCKIINNIEATPGKTKGSQEIVTIFSEINSFVKRGIQRTVAVDKKPIIK